MAQRAIKEFDCKTLFKTHWEHYFSGFTYDFKSVLVQSKKSLEKQSKSAAWLKKSPLVVKPDMLFGKRGKNKLVLIKKEKPGDITLTDAADWVNEKSEKTHTLLDGTTGKLNSFIIEPFLNHENAEEFYISLTTQGYHDVLNVSKFGGMDIEDHWDKVVKINIPVDSQPDDVLKLIQSKLKKEITDPDFVTFTAQLYAFFKDLHFTYLELNPIVVKDKQIFLLDAVAKLDDTAKYALQSKWGDLSFSSSFGMKESTPEELFIKELDENSGASLKLTLLNPQGRIWTLVAGGGASVVYADTIANLANVEELANYGEYSGNPSQDETYAYTKTVFQLMTKEQHKENKILIIGGAIANFTDVAKTFKGIIQAIKEFAPQLKKVGTHIYVRRGGPNYKIGLKTIKEAVEALEIPISVHGPETHMTDIVRLSLEK